MSYRFFSAQSRDFHTQYLKNIYLFIWLHRILGETRGTFVVVCRVFFVVVVLTCGIWFPVVQSLSYVRLFVTSWTACCTPSFLVQHQLLEFAQTHCPLSRWCHPTISSSIIPFSSCLQSFPASGSFPVSWLFISGGQILELLLQHQSFLRIFRVDFLWDWLFWSPCSPTDSQELSPAPQFKSINFSVLSLLYGPTLTSVYDYWKNHSFDYMDLCKSCL